MQKIFNIFSPIVSAIGEIEKNTFKRIEKNGIWYIANVENSGDHIYAITKNKNGMSGNKVKFKTENGEIFEETGVWHTSSDSLFSKTGIDLREKHYFEYIISKEKEGSLKPYSGSLYIDIVDYKEKHLGNPYNFENILSELMNKHKCNLYYAKKTSGGGSDGLKKYKK